jgi:hypothetical protein
MENRGFVSFRFVSRKKEEIFFVSSRVARERENRDSDTVCTYVTHTRACDPPSLIHSFIHSFGVAHPSRTHPASDRPSDDDDDGRFDESSGARSLGRVVDDDDDDETD